MRPFSIAIAMVALAICGASPAQNVEMHAGPGGAASGSVSVPSADVNESAPAARSSLPCRKGEQRQSVTVRSPGSFATTSVATSGGNSVVAGAGSPGSRIETSRCPPKAMRSTRKRRY